MYSKPKWFFLFTQKSWCTELKSDPVPYRYRSDLTRPDTRLSQSRAGGQGPYLRSLDHLSRSHEAKDHRNPRKVNCDRRTDGRTNWPTKRGVESRSTQLKYHIGIVSLQGLDGGMLPLLHTYTYTIHKSNRSILKVHFWLNHYTPMELWTNELTYG